MMTDDFSAATVRPIPHTEAREIAQRLINSHFRRKPGARVGIPARPDYDDDLLIMAYIDQCEAAVNAYRPQPEPVAVSSTDPMLLPWPQKPEPPADDVERAIQAACPYFLWYDDPQPIGKLADAPRNHPCLKCKRNDGPHGGTAGCRILVEPMVRAAIAALEALKDERCAEIIALSAPAGRGGRVMTELMLAYNEGIRTTFAAVVAWLREPNTEMLNVGADAIIAGQKIEAQGFAIEPIISQLAVEKRDVYRDLGGSVCRALADLLEHESHD